MKNKLFDATIDLKKRMFYVLATTAIVSNLLGAAANAVIFGLTAQTIVCLSCLLIIIADVIFGVLTNKTNIASGIIIGLVIILEFPYLYIYYGTSVVLYMFFGLIALNVFIEQKKRTPLFIATFVYDLVIIAVLEKLSSMGIYSQDHGNFLSFFCTFIITVLASNFMITMHIKQSELKNEELIRLNDKMCESLKYDQLTQIYNRAYFTNCLRKYTKDENAYVCAAMIDLDNFQKVNDKYGHEFGDKTLREFAHIISNTVLDDGMAARFDSESFIVLLNSNDVVRFTDLINNVRKEYIAYSQNEVDEEFTFSAAIEVYEAETDLHDFYTRLSEKLMRAKRNGKNVIISAGC